MIKIIFEPAQNRVAAYDGDKNIGEATYLESDNTWTIDHTFVDKNYGGQGIAAKLIDEVVKNARIEKAKIIPQCSYAVKKFETTPEYKDVLAK